MAESEPAALVAYVERAHTSRDPRVIGGTITHGGPNQYVCGFYPRGSHGGCAGCGGHGWYVEGRASIRPPEHPQDHPLVEVVAQALYEARNRRSWSAFRRDIRAEGWRDDARVAVAAVLDAQAKASSDARDTTRQDQ